MQEKRPSVRRWKAAQEHELDYWTKKLVEPGKLDEEISGYRKRAKEIVAIMREYLRLEQCVALQIGPAAVGEIHFLPCPWRCAVDPLATRYNSICPQAAANFLYVAGRGEAIPVRAASIDLVISTNLLDHVIDPAAVVHEIARILKPTGYIYFENHLYSRSAAGIRKMLEMSFRVLHIPMTDMKHPHSITYGQLQTWLSDANLQVVSDHLPSWQEARATYRADSRLRAKLLRGYGPFPVQTYMAVLRLRGEAQK
jgi:SAM-dependent methyltransferase